MDPKHPFVWADLFSDETNYPQTSLCVQLITVGVIAALCFFNICTEKQAGRLSDQ